MKKTFIAVAFMAAIIAAIMAVIITVRLILSATLSEQAAEVFCRVSASFVFFYLICRLTKNKLKTVN